LYARTNSIDSNARKNPDCRCLSVFSRRSASCAAEFISHKLRAFSRMGRFASRRVPHAPRRHTQPSATGTAAVEATLTRVDYDLRINGDLAAGRASLTVDVLKTAGCASHSAGLLVREARLDGKLVLSRTYCWWQSRRQLSHFFLIRVGPFYARDCSFLWPHRRRESISLPSAASGSLGFPADSSPGRGHPPRGGLLSENQKPPPKANGSRTAAAMKSSLHLAAKNRGPSRHSASALRGSLTQLLGLGEIPLPSTPK